MQWYMPLTFTSNSRSHWLSSSMDIIGLGDTNEVKVIKGASNGSNQHLFNCSNSTKADYIHVTLHNLYLDATEYNYKDNKARDNAAVQSIRKSKVKCYDLTVVKDAADFMQYAFYVNGNNPHDDGTKYTAYLYVEDCVLTVRSISQVVSTAGKYQFYHSGLVYNDIPYEKNSGSIKNVVMAANDWWD